MKPRVLAIATQVVVMAIVISVVLLFLGVGVLVLIHVCVLGRALRRGFINNNNNNIVERSSFGSTSMSRDDLEKLPCFDFKPKDKGSSPVDCAVCLENFKVGDKCRLLPLCRHSFHAECVDLWLLKTPICPICRASADLLRAGPISGEESSRYSESVVELRDIPATDGGHEAAAAIELRENQGAEGDHLTGDAADNIGLRRGQLTAESTQVSGMLLRENQTMERGCFNENSLIVIVGRPENDVDRSAEKQV